VSSIVSQTVRVVGVVVFLITGALLTSIGGLGIVAAPVTLPLLFLIVFAHPTRPFRVAGAIIGALTAAELTWGLLYLVGGKIAALSLALPAAAGVGTAVAFVRFRRTNVKEFQSTG
jgi:hypothetical protein